MLKVDYDYKKRIVESQTFLLLANDLTLVKNLFDIPLKTTWDFYDDIKPKRHNGRFPLSTDGTKVGTWIPSSGFGHHC